MKEDFLLSEWNGGREFPPPPGGCFLGRAGRVE